VLLVLSATFLLLNKKRPFLAGLVIGLTFLRPQFLAVIPLISAVYYQKGSLKRFLTGACLSLAVLLTINCLLYGPGFIKFYPIFLFVTESLSYGTNTFFNYNISSLLSLITAAQPLVNYLNLAINTVMYLLVLGWLMVNSSRIDKPLAFSAVVMLTPLLGLHTLPVDLVVLLLPLYVVCGYFYQRGRIREAGWFCGLLLILPWGAYLYLNFLTTIIFIIMGLWILKRSLGGDGGNRTPVLKAQNTKVYKLDGSYIWDKTGRRQP